MRAKAAALPRSLGEALAALGEDKALRAGFGDFFVDYYLKLKQAEIDRFESGSQRLGAAGVFFAVLGLAGPRASRPAHSLRLSDRARLARLMSARDARGPEEHERAWRPAVRQDMNFCTPLPI